MKKILLILFLIPALSLKGQTLQLDLQQCLQYAEEHNQDLQSGKLDVQTSDIQLKQAKLRQYPTVSAGIGQNFGYSHGSESFGINGNTVSTPASTSSEVLPSATPSNRARCKPTRPRCRWSR